MAASSNGPRMQWLHKALVPCPFCILHLPARRQIGGGWIKTLFLGASDMAQCPLVHILPARWIQWNAIEIKTRHEGVEQNQVKNEKRMKKASAGHIEILQFHQQKCLKHLTALTVLAASRYKSVTNCGSSTTGIKHVKHEFAYYITYHVSPQMYLEFLSIDWSDHLGKVKIDIPSALSNHCKFPADDRTVWTRNED